MRDKALAWWRSLSTKEKKEAVQKWKQGNDSFMATWSFEMISMSSSTIQLIWKSNENGI